MKIVTPYKVDFTLPCGIADSISCNFTQYVKETGVFQSRKRMRPSGAELLFNPTYLARSTQEFFGATVNVQIGHNGCWHGGRWNATSKTSVPVPLDLWLMPGPPSIPGGFEMPPVYDLYGEIKNQKVNLAMFCAEFAQTASMFSNAAQTLVKLYRDVKRGRVGTADTAFKRQLQAQRNRHANKKNLGTKAQADYWLTYTYGIAPLINDLKGSLKALEEARLSRPVIRTVRVKKESLDVSKSDLYYDGSKIGPVVTTVKKKAYYCAVVQYEPGFSQDFGFGNPISLAWEVIPYSFVVDWFVDVGGYLASLDALSGTLRNTTYAVCKGEAEVEYPGGSKGKSKTYVRTPLGALPRHPPAPTWDPSLSWKRIVSALSLLRQRI